MALTHLMIIDDSEADQFLCQLTAEDFNPDMQIQQAYNGAEALQMLASGSNLPQAILLDINMPIMNGFEFLEEFQQHYPDAAVVVSILSSSSHKADQEKAATYPCVKLYLKKPVTEGSLRELQALI